MAILWLMHEAECIQLTLLALPGVQKLASNYWVAFSVGLKQHSSMEIMPGYSSGGLAPGHQQRQTEKSRGVRRWQCYQMAVLVAALWVVASSCDTDKTRSEVKGQFAKRGAHFQIVYF